MDDFRRGSGSQRKPVADAVGDDEVTVAALVVPGPVAIHQRTETGSAFSISCPP